jgi:hypothetical protein
VEDCQFQSFLSSLVLLRSRAFGPGNVSHLTQDQK